MSDKGEGREKKVLNVVSHASVCMHVCVYAHSEHLNSKTYLQQMPWIWMEVNLGLVPFLHK